MGDASRFHRGANNTLPPESFGSQFVAMNKGKRSISLDLHTHLGAAVMAKLLTDADVFVTNYRASALARMGLDIHELTQKYPRLVVGHVNGFGPNGEDADKAMLDGAAQARGGLVSLSGDPDGTPAPPGVAIADHAGAMQTALGCMTALVTRARTGRGQLVQTSSLGAQLWLQMWELQHSFMTGTALTREGPHHPNIKAPYGVYMTQDQIPILFVAAMTDDAWTEFWIFVDRPEIVLMEQWNTPGKRIGTAGSDDALPEIRQFMKDAIGGRTMAQWAAFFRQPAGDHLGARPQSRRGPSRSAKHRKMAISSDLDVPISGKTATVGTLMAFSDTPTAPPKAPPGLGEHTAEVMSANGFSESDIVSVQTHSEAVKAEMFAALLGDG